HADEIGPLPAARRADRADDNALERSCRMRDEGAEDRGQQHDRAHRLPSLFCRKASIAAAPRLAPVGTVAHTAWPARHIRVQRMAPGLTRRSFLNLVGMAGGVSAAYRTMEAMGLLPIPEAYAGPPTLPAG